MSENNSTTQVDSDKIRDITTEKRDKCSDLKDAQILNELTRLVEKKTVKDGGKISKVLHDITTEKCSNNSELMDIETSNELTRLVEEETMIENSLGHCKTDTTCSQTSKFSCELIGQLDNQSIAEKTCSGGVNRVNIELPKTFDVSCGIKQETAPPLGGKAEPVLQGSGSELCVGETMDKTGELGFKNVAVNRTNPKGEVSDGKGFSGVVMDRDDHFKIPVEVVNADVAPHQVVIVNPFPTPEPPKRPVVNVTSNCQCDRFASLVRYPGTGVKKKGRAKKTGASVQNGEGNGQKTGSKSKKGSVNHENGKKRQLKSVYSTGKKGKKKMKDSRKETVKEISVMQPNLKAELPEENESIGAKTSPFQGSGVEFAPVHYPTSVKESFIVLTRLTPIPEASHSGSSAQGSVSDVFPSNPEHTGDVTSSTGPDKNKETTAPPVAKKVDGSRPDDADTVGNVSELHENLEDMIQQILDETSELQENHAKSHNTNTPGTSTNVDLNEHASKAETRENSKSDVAMNCAQSKQEYVKTWLLDHSDGNRDPSEFPRPVSADTKASSSSLESRFERWTTSSATISLPTNCTASDFGGKGQIEVVRSRIGRRKSEASAIGSETTGSEEEEIVWRKGNMLGKGAFGKVSAFDCCVTFQLQFHVRISEI